MKRFILLLCLVLTTGASANSEIFTEERQRALQEHLDRVAQALEKKDLGEVWSAIFARDQNLPFKSGIHEFMLKGIDNVERPVILYLPKNFDNTQNSPLLVYLHGGVGRASIKDKRKEYVQRNELKPIADKHGWPMLFPFADKTSQWWDLVGMANIISSINTIKKYYAIDHDRVWLSGFSDGASASFFFSMAMPDLFAGYVAMSGHMGVGSLDGGWELFPENITQSNMIAFHTDQDELYPTRKMTPMIDLVRQAGGDIQHITYAGYTHDNDYVKEKASGVIEEFLLKTRRENKSEELQWTAALPVYSSAKWIKIGDINEENPQDWHVEYNLELRDDRVSLGLTQYSVDEQGVMIRAFMEESLLAGLQAQVGDIISSINEHPVSDLDSLRTALKAVTRGEEIRISIMRDDEKLMLVGQTPEVATYPLFPHKVPNGAIRAEFDLMLNTFTVETSKLNSFTIKIDPKMVDLSRPLVVQVNGIEMFNKMFTVDFSHIRKQYTSHLDSGRLYVGEIDIQL